MIKLYLSVGLLPLPVLLARILGKKDLAYIRNKNGILAKLVHSLPMLPEPFFYQDAKIAHITGANSL